MVAHKTKTPKHHQSYRKNDRSSTRVVAVLQTFYTAINCEISSSLVNDTPPPNVARADERDTRADVSKVLPTSTS